MEDAFGNPITSNTSTVTIAVASGPGGFTTGSKTSVAAVSGVATFSNLVLDTAGSYTFTVSDGGFTSATTGAITVSPAAATKLVFQQTPPTGTAGQALSPSVSAAVEDTFGNVVTSNTSTVTIALASGPGGLTTGSTTSVAAVSGVATFSNLVLDTAGTYTFKATDGTLTSVTSANISVNPAAASQLVLEQAPTSGTAGQALSPSVKAALEDPFGNVVTSNTSTVTVAVASGPGGFAAGSTNSVAAVSGVATFSNLILDTSGSDTLSVSDSGLTGATTGAISVSPASASKLVLQQTPTSGTAGQALGTLKAAVEDAFGNVLSSNTSTVTIAVASGPGGLTAGSTTSVAAVSGVATFSNLVLDTSGSYTFTVSDSGFTGATTGAISVSPAAASKLVLQQTPTTGTAGQALSPSLSAAVEDAFGNVVTSNTSTVTIAVASGPGGLTAGSTTSVAAVSGVATFSNLVLDTSGSYTLSVSESGLTGATTGAISVSPATASKLVLQQTPTSGTAGQALSPSVSVIMEDAFGNVLTGNTSTVTIAVASGPGGLTTGSTTSVAAVSGVATFSNLVLDTSGSYTFTVSDSGFTSATTGAISVSPAAASKLVLQQTPTTGTAGQALSPSVSAAVEDAFGNVVTSNTSTVTIALASGPGGLTTGSTTSVAAVSGVATFSNLVLDTSGTYSLKATDGTLTSVTSGNISVNPATASKLVLQQTPTSGTAGQALSPSVSVAVEDAFGNVLTGNTSTVTIAVASGPGGLTTGSTTSVAAVSGVATFSNLVLDTSGSYTFTVSESGLTGATTGAISVSPAGASKLVLQQTPTSGTAGQALSPSVSVILEDAFGNVLTGNTSTVTIAVASGPGGLTTGSTTSVAAVSGVATFSNLVLDTSGSYTLTVSESGLTGATTGAISVSPAGASQLVLEQAPTSGTVGQARSPSVKAAVEDAFGNVVTGNTSTVTIAVASGPGGLTTGSTTSVAAVSGVATFSNLILNASGSDTLSVSDSGLTGATTGAISVSSAGASKLVLQQTPTSGTAGQALSPSVSVAVEDAFGNVLTGNTSTVTIAVASGPGGLTTGSTTSVAAVSGVATFSNLVLDTSGSYTLSVSESGLTGATTGAISVSPAGASKLVLQQTPTSGTAGQALSPSVSAAVEDAFGNVVTSNTSAVTIAVASGPGGFAAGSTISAAAVSGVATFSNLVLDTSGSYTFTVSDSGSTGATTGAISVSPASASQLVLQQTPTSGTAAQALSPSVNAAVEDAFGNVVTGNTSTVTIAVASGPSGFAAGSTSSVAAVSGVATFSNLVLDTSGSYTLTVSESGLTGTTTGAISVSPAATDPSPSEGSSTLGALTVTLQQGVNGYTGMTNAYITNAKNTDTKNYAGSTTLLVSPESTVKEDDALLRWDLSSAGITGSVQSVTITLNVTGLPTSSGPFDLYELNTSWNPNSVTYDQAATSQPWETAGAYGANDSGTTILGVLNPTTLGQETITLNAAGIAVVQSWVNNPSSNDGFILRGDNPSGILTFSSNADPTASNHPSMVIGYQEAGIFVSAGPNAGVTQTSVLTLNGSVVDNDSGATEPVTTTWSVDSGPGTVTFENASSVTSDAVFSMVGTYVLQLSATDGVLSSASQVTITVEPPPPDLPPIVNAGANETITLGQSATLAGQVTQAGTLPLTDQWSQLSGPGTAIFANSQSPSTTAQFTASGTYVLDLAATDGTLAGNSTVTVTVNAPGSSATNLPPVASAGANQTANQGAVVSLNGSVTYTSFPGATLATVWQVANGPGTVTFANSGAPLTTATFSAAGTYYLRLLATYGTATDQSYTVITVDPPAQASSYNLQQGLNGYSGAADSYIDSKNATTNYNTSTTLAINDNSKDTDEALLSWNLSGVTGTVQSASITVYVTTASTVTYDVYALSRAWNASQVTDQVAESGQYWENSGAAGSNDYNSTLLGTLNSTTTGFATITLNAAGIAVVQGWINSPSSNYGFIIEGASSGLLDFASSKYATVADRPMLAINMSGGGSTSPPPSNPPITNPAASAAAAVNGTSARAGLHERCGTRSGDALLPVP